MEEVAAEGPFALVTAVDKWAIFLATVPTMPGLKDLSKCSSPKV